MADLGNLYFSVMLKDLTDKQIKNIKNKLDNLGVKVNTNLGFDKREFRKSMTDYLRANTFNAKVDVVIGKSSAQKAVREALRKAGMSTETTAGELRQQRILEIQERMKQRAVLSEERLRAAKLRTATAEERNRRAMEKMNQAMSRQTNLASRLSEQMGTIFSVYALERFASRLIEIGGMFQTQHIALKAMLGDAAQADTIFSQIKSLAIESPFTFMDLSSYTKQLAAFSIPYNELYDTTKRLADISAGLGVDMGRIILAYGQVRSAAFLRGQEVRQFTEAGIPLLDALAEKFTELEGRVISVGEVFDKISRREVPFEMVREVLWDMTNEGGQFYNMQSQLVESLSGKYDKLKDSLQIMMGEIADSNRGMLGGALDMLTSLADHWESVIQVLNTAVVAFGTYKATMITINAVTAAAVIQKRGLATASVFATKALNGETVAMKVLNAQTSKMIIGANRLRGAFAAIGKGGWVGLVLTAVAGIATWIGTAVKQANRLQAEFKKIEEESVSSELNLSGGYRRLVSDLENASRGTKEYKEIIGQINSTYGQYLDKLYDEAEAYETVKDSVDSVTAAIREKLRQQEYEKKASAIESEYAETFAEIQEEIAGRISQDFDVDGKTGKRMAAYVTEMMRSGTPADDALRQIAQYYDRGEVYDQLQKFYSNMYDFPMQPMLEEYAEALKEYRAEMDGIADSGTFVKRVLDDIAEKYKTALSGARTPDEQRETELQMLREQLSALEGMGLPGGDKAIKKIKANIAALDQLDKEWVKLTNDIMGTSGKLALTDTYMANPVSYFEMLAKELDSSKKVIEELSGLGETVGKDPMAKGQIDRAEQQIKRIEALGKALGIDIMSYGTKESQKVDDPLAKQWKERLALLKEAVNEYEKYSELYGAQEAQQKLSGSGMFAGLGDDFDFTQAKKALADFVQEMSSTAQTEGQKDVAGEGLRLVMQLRFNADKESLDDALNATREEIEKQTEKWDLYNKLYESSGNKKFSIDLLGKDIEIWDDAATALKETLGGKMAELGLPTDGLWEKTEEEAEAVFGQNGELFGLWKEINGRIEQNGIELKLDIAEAYGKVKTLQDKINDLRAERDSKLKEIRDSGYGESSTEYKSVKETYDDDLNGLWTEFLEDSGWVDKIKSYVKDRLIGLLSELNTSLSSGKITGDAEIEETKAQISIIEGILDKMKNGVDGNAESWGDLNRVLGDSADVFDEIGALIPGVVGEAVSQVGQMGAAAVSLAKGIDVVKTSTQALEKATAIFAIISAAIKIISFIPSVLNANAEAAENSAQALWDYTEALEAANEESRLTQFETVFGEDAYGKFQEAISLEKKNIDEFKKGVEDVQRSNYQEMANAMAKYPGMSYSMLNDDLLFSSDMRSRWQKFFGTGDKNIHILTKEDILDENGEFDGEKLKDWYEAYGDGLEDEHRRMIESLINDWDQYQDAVQAQFEYMSEMFDDISSKITGGLLDKFLETGSVVHDLDEYTQDFARSLAESVVQSWILESVFNDDLKNAVLETLKEGNPEKAVDLLGEAMEGVEDMFPAIEEFFQSMGIEQLASSADSLTKGIESVTEETAGLLASYINAMRADLSVMRSMFGEFAPQVNTILQAQVTHLESIAANTFRNAEMAEEIRDLLQRNVNGGNKFNIK